MGQEPHTGGHEKQCELRSREWTKVNKWLRGELIDVEKELVYSKSPGIWQLRPTTRYSGVLKPRLPQLAR